MGYLTAEQFKNVIESVFQLSGINFPFLGLDFIYSLPVITKDSRWLRFDPTNRQGLVVRARTFIKRANGIYFYSDEDLHVDFSDQALQPGKTYRVFLTDGGEFKCSLEKVSQAKQVGYFSTLCVDAGNSLTMITAASPNSGYRVGDSYLIKPYDQEEDLDFYQHYNKSISNIAVNATHYDTITLEHPLCGFKAGDILPESVFCTTFRPQTNVLDAMVYDKVTGIAIDVYLQSGMGFDTRSVYQGIHTGMRKFQNQQSDLLTVGKRMLKYFEFTSAACGSNEGNYIAGAADAVTVGGHSTSNRRMITAIGCEETAGYLPQMLDEVTPTGGSAWTIVDGIGKFGKSFGSPYYVLCGVFWGSSTGNSGSRGFNSSYYFNSTMDQSICSRGCSDMLIKNSFTML